MIRENLGFLIAEREDMDQALLKQASEEFDRIKESLDEEVTLHLKLLLYYVVDQSERGRRRGHS